MNTRTISLAAVFLVPFFACAQTPDLTSSLEFIANPQMDWSITTS